MNTLRCRPTIATLVITAAAAAAVAAPAAATAASVERPTFSAQLLFPLRAREHPVASARSARYLTQFTPLTGQPALLPIVGQRTVHHEIWLRVMLPGRPNNRTGWIPAAAARKVPLKWRLRIDISNRALAVFRNGNLQRRVRVVVGKPSTPTPRGRFFVTERVRLTQAWGLHGWALALSAYSDVLRRFDGGPGQVAIHSRGSLFDPLGSAASHGCVRVTAATATWLAKHVPPGAFVEIVR